MKNKWKKTVAFAMSLSLVAVNSTVSLSNSNTIVAKASEANSLVNETEETESVNKVASEKEVDESYYDADTKTLHLKGYVRNSEDNTGLVLPEDAYGKDIINIVADKGTVLPVDSSYLFYKSGAETIDLKNADASNVTNMSYMFDSCMNIKSLDMSNLDTSNVTNMASMFSYWWHCADYINLSGLDTSNVTDMSYMFYFNSTEPFDLTVLDTSSVTDMSWMFAWGGDTILDLSSFETSNVTDMSYMFYMTDPETIYVGPDWTAKPAFSESMFEECYYIVGGAGTVYDPEHVDAEYAHVDGGEEYPGYLTFKNPYKNESYFDAETGTLHLKGNVIKNANNEGIVLPDGIEKDDVLQIFAEEGTVLPADCSNFCYELDNLYSVDLHNADTSNVTDMSDMFLSHGPLFNIDISGFDTSNVTDMSGMFSGYKSTSLDLTSLDTSNVTDMSSMFDYCYNLESIDLSNFDTSKVVDMHYMFSSCASLESLDLSSFDTSNVTTMYSMFSLYSNSSLKSIDLSSFDTSNVTDMTEMFLGLNSLEELDLRSFDTSNVTDMSGMFAYCTSLSKLDLSNFDTSNVTDMAGRFSLFGMFEFCNSLETIIVGDGWSTDSVKTSDDMFYGCEKIKGGAGTVYDPQHTDAEYARIDGGNENPGYFTSVKGTNEEDTTIIIIIPEETMNAISYLYNNINNPTLKNIASTAMNFLSKYFSFKIV
ncbi:BspA family leucine-rich repeat surface protein [Ruminococcus sp.]|uniref:BspA family leucine-rich repeat surface protein n=1 Tax=Ruminococcus sp. TaxID=41978 RepID=UPI0025D1C708|nr:BspA family leucine-rich repeat surface protein [Ruminococcus sp.]